MVRGLQSARVEARMTRSTWILLALTACGPTTVTPDASTDAALDQTSSEAGNDAEVIDAANDVTTEDAPFDAGSCSLSPVDGGTCNALAATGSVTVPQCHAGPAPTPAGGNIYNGRYVLTHVDYYNSSGTCPTDQEQIDWSICGTEWETVQIGNNQTTRVNATVVPSGNTLSLTLTCPNPNTSTWMYDATSTGLVLYLTSTNADGGIVIGRADTYARQ